MRRIAAVVIAVLALAGCRLLGDDPAPDRNEYLVAFRTASIPRDVGRLAITADGAPIAIFTHYPVVAARLARTACTPALPDHEISYWNIVDGTYLGKYDSGDSVRSTTIIGMLPDGAGAFVAGDRGPVRELSYDSAFWFSLVRTSDGAWVRTFGDGESVVRYTRPSPDGRYVVSFDWEDHARIWDVATGAAVRAFSDAGAVAFSPDGRYVVREWVGYAVVYRMVDGATVDSLVLPAGFMSAPMRAAITDSGYVAISGGGARRIAVFRIGGSDDPADWSTSDSVTALAATGDGRFIAGCADGTIDVWDPSSAVRECSVRYRSALKFYEPWCPMYGQQRVVYHHAPRFFVLTPDGARLVSAHEDGMVCVWPMNGSAD